MPAMTKVATVVWAGIGNSGPFARAEEWAALHARAALRLTAESDTTDEPRLMVNRTSALNRSGHCSSGAEDPNSTWHRPKRSGGRFYKSCVVHGTMMEKGMGSEAAEKPRMPHGVVATYSPHDRGYRDSHERGARTEIAKRLAALKGYAFAGEYDASACYAGPVYFVPSDTLLGVEATNLGIRSEHDLFGGVVPYGFVATKAITHPLVDSSSHAPTGWSHEFACRVHAAVLFGFSAFTHEDARRAGARLLERGPGRTKPARATAGRDQTVVSEAAELEAVLNEIEAAGLSNSGLVLEENLTDVVTYSVGQVRVAELVATYLGVQRFTTDNRGEAVYGGSDLVIARGDFDALLGLGLSDEARLAVSQAHMYDSAAVELLPGLFASRRNYDVAAGLDAQGQRRCGVLEQSWRMGGASGAEIAALEAFRAEPTLGAVRASTFETYGESEPPPQATVYFRGVDERIGPITKYTTVESYGDAR